MRQADRRNSPLASSTNSTAKDRPTVPISVIIPAFGRQDLLDEAVSSIMQQESLPHELIVVDDGSPMPLVVPAGARDASLQIRLIRHDVNRGAAAARNTGLSAAQSDWIAFLDSDDRLLPDSLRSRWSLIASHPDHRGRSAFCCGWTEFGENMGETRGRIPRPATGIEDFASGCWFSPGSCLIINQALLTTDGAMQDESLRRFEDYDWFLQLALRGWKLEALPVVGAEIRRARYVSPQLAESAAARIMAKWQATDLAPNIRRRVKAYMALECAAANWYAGRRGRALGFLARSLAAVPRLSLQLSPGWDDAPSSA